MIKAFISHSSKQKDFATRLVNLIGRDLCLIDCYDFEPAYKSIDEIYRAIEKCTIFVLLISRDSLASDWVKKLIHTTNMQNGSLVHLKSIVPGLVARVEGFGVVIPRVCNPNPSKIVLLDGSESYVLSDCVIVLRSASKHDAVSVRQYILNNWAAFVSIYKGTGAQYTTLARVKDLFKVRV